MRGASTSRPWERDGRPLLTEDGHRQLGARVDHLRHRRLPQFRPLLREDERDERQVAEFERLLLEAATLESLLSEAAILVPDPLDFDGRVDIGMRVLIRIDDEDTWVRPVHPDEAFLDDERISCRSPLATALIGARAGQTVWVAAPRGTHPCQVLDVQPS